MVLMYNPTIGSDTHVALPLCSPSTVWKYSCSNLCLVSNRHWYFQEFLVQNVRVMSGICD